MREFHRKIHDCLRLAHGEYLKIASKPLDAGLNHSIHAEIPLMENLPILFRGFLRVENAK